MQNCEQAYIRERAIYYLCRAMSRQGERGANWKFNLKAVYGIFFLNFEMKDSGADGFGCAADAAACLPYRKYSMKSQKSALKSRHPSAISASSGSTPFSTRAIAAAMRVMVGPSRVSISASGSTPLRRTTVRR